MQMNITNMEQQAYGRDQELMNAILKLQAGDAAAFDTIYLHTNRFMFQKAGQILASYHNKDSELRNDMVQDAYIKIFNNISSLQEPSRFYGWINTILVNTIYAYTRAHWREAFDVVDEEGDSMVEGICHDTDTPEARILEKEKIDYINSALDTLPPLQRYTVEFYYYSEMSVEDIAKTMDCSEGTVKSRLNYARQKLKGAIEEIERTKKIKIYSIFALPALLFAAKEEALVSVTAVDAASFASVREALHRECILKATAPAGGNNMNNEYSNNNAINNNYTQENPQTQIPPQPQGTMGVPVSSVSTSIFKTAVGKIIIAITAVLVTVGVIMGGYFIFGDGDEEDTPVIDEDTPIVEEEPDEPADGPVQEDEPTDEPVVDEPAVDEPAVDEPEDTSVIVDENGYIHIGSNSGEGTPSYYLYKENDALNFYTDVKPTYFTPGETVTINAGYTVFAHWRPEVDGFYAVDLTGAYKLSTWEEGVEIDGISYEEYVNSGATGIYVDGNSFTVTIPDTDQTTLTGSSYFSVYDDEQHIISLKFAEDASKRFISTSEMFPIDYTEQCYYVSLYAFQNEDIELLEETFTCEEPILELAIKQYEDEWEGYYQASFSAVIDRDSTEELYQFKKYYKGSSCYFGQPTGASITEDYSEYAFMVGYYFDDEYTNEDEHGVAGKMITLMHSYETLLREQLEPLVDMYFETEDVKLRALAYEQMCTPTTVVVFDKEYTYYPYEAYAPDYGEIIKYVYGYLIPTGNTVEVTESEINLTKPESEEETEQVTLPEVTLAPYAFYSKATSMTELQAMQEQYDALMEVLYLEMEYEFTGQETGNAVRNILSKANELYFMVCADNAYMTYYSAINDRAWLADYGMPDFTVITDRYVEKASFNTYVCNYMGGHIGSGPSRLSSIKDSLNVIAGTELTANQKKALIAAKEMLTVFCDNNDNYEFLLQCYEQEAEDLTKEGCEYFRKQTSYEERRAEIDTYWQLIAEVPNWTFE